MIIPLLNINYHVYTFYIY